MRLLFFIYKSLLQEVPIEFGNDPDLFLTSLRAGIMIGGDKPKTVSALLMMAETMISGTAPNQALDYRLYIPINTPDSTERSSIIEVSEGG